LTGENVCFYQSIPTEIDHGKNREVTFTVSDQSASGYLEVTSLTELRIYAYNALAIHFAEMCRVPLIPGVLSACFPVFTVYFPVFYNKYIPFPTDHRVADDVGDGDHSRRRYSQGMGFNAHQ